MSPTSISGIAAVVGCWTSAAAAPRAAAASTNAWPSRSATRATKSSPGRRVRESNEAPRRSTSPPWSVPPVAWAAADARILIAPNGTVDVMPSDRIHLVVLFGGQSAEHDVSCVTATAVLGAADPDRYRITPIGISREGALGARRQRPARPRRRAGGAPVPARPGRHGGHARGRPGRRRRRDDGRAPAAARPDGRGRDGAGPARAGRRRLRRLRGARLGAGDGQGDGQAGARVQRHRPDPPPCLPGPRPHPRPAQRPRRASSACRAS